MEQNQDSSLFGINVDQTGRSHLVEAARWAKFLAVIGFIYCGLIVLAGLFVGSIMNLATSKYGGPGPYNDFPSTPGFTAVVAVYYIVLALILFFPCLFLYRFAVRMKKALASNDQDTLNVSFQNLKASLRFMGILTIIALVFVLLAFLIGFLGILAGSNI